MKSITEMEFRLISPYLVVVMPVKTGIQKRRMPYAPTNSGFRVALAIASLPGMTI
jgi:hypothetical protein